MAIKQAPSSKPAPAGKPVSGKPASKSPAPKKAAPPSKQQHSMGKAAR